MRDPQRIEDILLAIAEVWSLDPDLRLGQLLVNAVRSSGPCQELFNVEDHDLVRMVQAEGKQVRGERQSKLNATDDDGVM